MILSRWSCVSSTRDVIVESPLDAKYDLRRHFRLVALDNPTFCFSFYLLGMCFHHLFAIIAAEKVLGSLG